MESTENRTTLRRASSARTRPPPPLPPHPALALPAIPSRFAAAIDAQTRGAGVLVDTAKGLVQYAETAHKVASAAEMAGGATALLRTGATLLVREGYRACVRAAATQLMTNVASGVAAEFANGVADYVGIDPQYRQYIAIGVNAFQVIAFFKAAKNKVDWNGSCFLAGTQVVTGVDANGVFSTKSIEDLQVGDTVLARDQHDPADDLDPRKVVNVFRKTSDHVRTLTLVAAEGNETIETTDEHPFWLDRAGWVGSSQLTVGQRVVLGPETGQVQLPQATRAITHSPGRLATTAVAFRRGGGRRGVRDQ